MWLIIATAVLAICVAYLCVNGTLRHFHRKHIWKQPMFVKSYTSEVLGICSKLDYERAKKIDSVIIGPDMQPLVVVPQTITFSRKPADNLHQYSGFILCEFDHEEEVQFCRTDFEFPPAIPVTDLFIPYASEKFLAFGEQSKMFRKIDPRMFSDAKTREFINADWRRKLAFWWSRKAWANKATIMAILGLLTSLLMLCSIGWTYTDSLIEASIVKGTVIDIQQLGGNEALVSLRTTTNMTEYYGVTPADNIPKKGDTAYIRYGQVRYLRIGTDYYYRRYTWIISETEAASMVATGKFHIVK